MASYQKKTSAQGVAWRVQVARKGIRESATFHTKAEAQAWAAERETEIRKGLAVARPNNTLQDAFNRYEKEVSVHKRGRRWEIIRMRAIAAHVVKGKPLGGMKLGELTPAILGAWRDMRMSGAQAVSGSTINRDLNLLSHVFSTARKEWGWIDASPTTNVRRPKESPPRDRRITQEEIDTLTLVLGFDGTPVQTKSAAVAAAFLFAIETGMRAGEICGLKPASIRGSVAHLAQTKNGRKRDVPLSPRASEILQLLPPDQTPLFGISVKTLDALFRRARQRVGIDDMTFHDTRHEAITRLASKLSVLDLARVVGHNHLNQLQTYYNETAENLVAKLR